MRQTNSVLGVAITVVLFAIFITLSNAQSFLQPYPLPNAAHNPFSTISFAVHASITPTPYSPSMGMRLGFHMPPTCHFTDGSNSNDNKDVTLAVRFGVGLAPFTEGSTAANGQHPDVFPNGSHRNDVGDPTIDLTPVNTNPTTHWVGVYDAVFREFWQSMSAYTYNLVLSFHLDLSNPLDLANPRKLVCTEAYPSFAFDFAVLHPNGTVYTNTTFVVPTMQPWNNNYQQDSKNNNNNNNDNQLFLDNSKSQAHLYFNQTEQRAYSTLRLPPISPEVLSTLTKSSKLFLLPPEPFQVTPRQDTFFTTRCTLTTTYPTTTYAGLKRFGTLSPTVLNTRKYLVFTLAELLTQPHNEDNTPPYGLEQLAHGAILTCEHDTTQLGPITQYPSDQRKTFDFIHGYLVSSNNFGTYQFMLVPNPVSCDVQGLVVDKPEDAMSFEELQKCAHFSPRIAFGTVEPYTYQRSLTLNCTNPLAVDTTHDPVVLADRFLPANVTKQQEKNYFYSTYHIHIPYFDQNIVDQSDDTKKLTPRSLVGVGIEVTAEDATIAMNATYAIQCLDGTTISPTNTHNLHTIAKGDLVLVDETNNHAGMLRQSMNITYKTNNNKEKTPHLTTQSFTITTQHAVDQPERLETCGQTVLSVVLDFKTKNHFTSAEQKALPRPLINVVMPNLVRPDDTPLFYRYYPTFPIVHPISPPGPTPDPDPTPTPTPTPDDDSNKARSAPINIALLVTCVFLALALIGAVWYIYRLKTKHLQSGPAAFGVNDDAESYETF